MSEFLQNDQVKQEQLKAIVQDIHAGKDIEEIKQRFAKLIKNVSAEEISDMENALIKEGFPADDIRALCDVHVSVFESALKKEKNPKKMPGHPVHTYLEENKTARGILKELGQAIKKAKNGGGEELSTLKTLFVKLKDIEFHFQRKENQLFPFLESVGFDGPTQVMWGKHDEIRDLMKDFGKSLNEGEWKNYKGFGNRVIDGINSLMFMEENILYPTALRKLDEITWAKIRQGESEIGYAWIKPGNLWDANIIIGKHTETVGAGIDKQTPGDDQEFYLEEGYLSIKQINLMLKNLPVDVTYVDENDKVKYYSQGKERVFPRSPGIIGRDVQNCHPPKSVHIVEKIVAAFKNKEKETAEFWLQMGGKFIHIQYFALYDDEGEYKGVIEVSQDATHIRSLEGDRRLLDWD